MTSSSGLRVGRRGTVLAAGVLSVLVLASGCGSSGGSKASPTPTQTTAAAAPSGSAQALACPTTSPAVTVVPGLTGTEATVAANWEAFFSKNTPLAVKPCYLQNGAQLQSEFATFATNPTASGALSQLNAKVTKVALTGPSSATVTYDLSLGTTTIPGSSGSAVLDNGTWKVSLVSLCSLLSLAQINVPACSAPPTS